VNDKEAALDSVAEAAEDYRESQDATGRARERFIDSIIDAKDAKATQQEIAQRCVIESDNTQKHLSRQRVAQFINERKPDGPEDS
jgi:hypothetical protein